MVYVTDPKGALNKNWRAGVGNYCLAAAQDKPPNQVSLISEPATYQPGGPASFFGLSLPS